MLTRKNASRNANEVVYVNGKQFIMHGVNAVETGVTAFGKSGIAAVDWLRRRTPIMFGRTQYGVGNPPGILVEDRTALPTTIRCIGYGPDILDERESVTSDDIRDLIGKYPVLWIDVTGLGNPQEITKIGELFGLHPLTIEDIGNAGQRPKTEYYDDIVFTVARMISVSPAFEVSSEQLGVVLHRGVVLTFQERPGDCLDSVRNRIRSGVGRIRNVGADYLAYAIIDAVVDSYFPILERYGDEIEVLEEQAVTKPTRATVAGIHSIRRDILAIRRSVWPLRDAINSLIRDENQLITDETNHYLRDCHDHSIRAIDIIEIYRELMAGLMDTYISSSNYQQNEVMKVLTIIATIFIPLTFVAGVYGMNFNSDVSPWNMPELHWYWGYPTVIAGMFVVAVALVLFFRQRRWF